MERTSGRVLPDATLRGHPPRALRTKLLQRLFSRSLAVAGSAIVVGFVAIAFAAPLLTAYSPLFQDASAALSPPSPQHWLGTDQLGRDVFSRLVYGSHLSLEVGILTVILSLAAGVPLGLTSGYFSGVVDNVIMRLMDALLAFPALVLALAIAAALPPSLASVTIAIGVVGIPTFARLVRGQSLAVREREFVMAARVLGASSGRILLRHVWPNVTEPVIIQGSLAIGYAVLAEASLSFLGLGVPPPTPSWGSMLKTSYGFLEIAPWLALAPGVSIFLLVLGFNFLGDGLRDALDPRLKL